MPRGISSAQRLCRHSRRVAAARTPRRRRRAPPRARPPTPTSRPRRRRAERWAATDLGVACLPGRPRRTRARRRTACDRRRRAPRWPPRGERRGTARRRHAAALVPRPRRGGEVLQLGEPPAVVVDPSGEAGPAGEQRLVGHLERRFPRRTVAVGRRAGGRRRTSWRRLRGRGESSLSRARRRVSGPPSPGTTSRANSSRAPPRPAVERRVRPARPAGRARR